MEYLVKQNTNKLQTMNLKELKKPQEFDNCPVSFALVNEELKQLKFQMLNPKKLQLKFFLMYTNLQIS
jgi:hypothetical protein